MGLTIGVGGLSEAARSEPDEFAEIRQAYDVLNETLAEAGMAPHNEPLDIAAGQVFEAEMWGYGGLHSVRRLAAYHACKGQLPPPGRYEDYVSDPITEQLNQQLLRDYRRREGGFVTRWLTLRSTSRRFQHLLWHSDCEGFYLPRDFEHVVLDSNIPQRPFIGGMIGSSVRLLQDCNELAELISLPRNIDIEADEVIMNAQSPPTEGAPWQRYGVETFCLARLIRGCELSIKYQAALRFH